MRSPASLHENRAYSLENFPPSVQNDFCNKICQYRTKVTELGGSCFLLLWLALNAECYSGPATCYIPTWKSASGFGTPSCLTLEPISKLRVGVDRL